MSYTTTFTITLDDPFAASELTRRILRALLRTEVLDAHWHLETVSYPTTPSYEPISDEVRDEVHNLIKQAREADDDRDAISDELSDAVSRYSGGIPKDALTTRANNRVAMTMCSRCQAGLDHNCIGVNGSQLLEWWHAQRVETAADGLVKS